MQASHEDGRGAYLSANLSLVALILKTNTMATKAFKKLPKKAQRAAFAEMEDDGTRKGNVPVKKLKNTSTVWDTKTRKPMLIADLKLQNPTKKQISNRIANLKKMK